MTVKIFVVTLVIFAHLVRSGTSLLCYGCAASTTSDCFDGVIPSYIVQNCQVPATQDLQTIPLLNLLNGYNSPNDNREEPIKTVCVQFTLPDFKPKKAFERGCGYIYKNVDICEYLQNITNVEGCSFCEEHLCNSDPGTQRSRHNLNLKSS